MNSMLSDVYTLDPSTVRFDDKYVIFNPLHNSMEYEATKANIEKLGQLDPILMLDKLCIDGRHRVRIAIELGIPVRCVDVDPATSEQDIIVLCNKGIMSGRDYDNTQKAIQALVLVNRYSMTSVAAAKFMKVDKRMVAYASTIKGFNRQDILDTLMTDKQNRIQLTNMERPSRSLELLAKYIKSEDERPKLVIDDSERIKWDPDAAIHTESGKAWYYSALDSIAVLGEIKLQMLLTEMANMKFKLDTDKDNK